MCTVPTCISIVYYFFHPTSFFSREHPCLDLLILDFSCALAEMYYLVRPTLSDDISPHEIVFSGYCRSLNSTAHQISSQKLFFTFFIK